MAPLQEPPNSPTTSTSATNSPHSLQSPLLGTSNTDSNTDYTLNNDTLLNANDNSNSYSTSKSNASTTTPPAHTPLPSLKPMYPFFFLVGLLALGMGMTLATVPTRISTAFAISSNSNSSISCVNRDQDTCLNSNKQDFDPCGDASDHAQDVTALSDSVKNLLTFFSAGLLGEISDIRGRKPVLVLAFVIQSLPSLAYFFILFYLHQVQDSTSLSTPSDYATLGSLPYIYYSLNAVTGIANFLTLVITCTADVLPAGPARAVAVGVILAIFFAGVSMAPLIVNSLIPSDVATAALSYLIIGVAVPLYACFGLKESLTPAVAFQAKLQREQKQGGETTMPVTKQNPSNLPSFRLFCLPFSLFRRPRHPPHALERALQVPHNPPPQPPLQNPHPNNLPYDHGQRGHPNPPNVLPYGPAPLLHRC